MISNSINTDTIASIVSDFINHFIMGSPICFHLLLIFSLVFSSSKQAASHSSVVKTLPGFPGNLPFKLETGYISVGESELFYYFVESEGQPRVDPLILYQNGGPGCSALNGFFYQVGPLVFNTTNYEGGLPALNLNIHSWTKIASIIFLDAPVGTGFSYARTAEGYTISDTISATQTHQFIRKWLNDHPEFSLNQFFLGSNSYSGLVTPVTAEEILNGNEFGLKPRINLMGFLIGSPHTDTALELNSVVPYAYRMALISHTLYESARNYCEGKYVDVDPSLAKCLEKLETIFECTQDINESNILDPKCDIISLDTNNEQVRRSLRENSGKFISSLRSPNYLCRDFDYLFSDIWANDKNVQEALHVREGTVKEWVRCNTSLAKKVYTNDISSAIGYHKNLTNSKLQVLLYSGDHDMVVPHISTEQWIRSLNLSVETTWRPWFVDGQIGGYIIKYVNYGYRLTYATVKGAGHSPTEYRGRECYKMFERWIHYDTL